ncbi:MAG: CoxG family protein [Chloroflexota bacterium]
MEFQHSTVLPATRECVWALLMDVPEVCRCVPGVDEVVPAGDGTYQGRLRLRVGPVALSFAGTLALDRHDEAAGSASIAVRGRDAKVAGAVAARLDLQLRELGPSEVELDITTKADIQGKLGEFGQPLIRRKTEQLMAEFAENLRQRLVQG